MVPSKVAHCYPLKASAELQLRIRLASVGCHLSGGFPVIIWGSTTKNKIVEQGEFYCPQCRGFSGYLHRCVQQYFTLYFIPLFPTSTLGEYLECQQCGGNFDLAIRELSAGRVESMLLPWTCAGCQNLNPASEMRCLRCQAMRPQHGAADQVPRPPEAADQKMFPELPPKPIPQRSTNKKKVSASQHWQKARESNRCRECGVINSTGDLRCRVCGSGLGMP
jgi:hypothetical protein